MSDDKRDKLGLKMAERMFPTSDLVNEARRGDAKKILGLWNTLQNEKSELSAYFLVTNNRVDFTYVLSSVVEAPESGALAEALVRAVEEFEVKHEEFKHEEMARSDGRTVRYTKHAKVSWEHGTITTNFVPEEGSLFLSCMGTLVVELRKQDKTVAKSAEQVN